MENFKKITGIAFLTFGILGILMCLSYVFHLRIFENDSDIFGRAFDNDSAPNTPTFFGLITISGTLLLNSLTTNIRKDKDQEK
jgi:hypothetical protein